MPPESDQALDRWLSASLSEAFGGVKDERLPEEWLQMIEHGFRD